MMSAESIYVNSRISMRDFTDELEDSYLNLLKIEGDQQGATYVLKWTIQNFRSMEKAIAYNGPHVRIGDTLHRLRVLKHDTKYPMLGGDRRLIYICLGITPLPASVDVSFSISNEQKEIKRDEIPRAIPGNIPNRNCYVPFEEVKELFLESLDLTVLCRLVVLDEIGSVRIVRNHRVLEDLEFLLQSGKFSDLSVIIGDNKLMTHRAILGVRSPVFAAMFQNEMAENSKRELVIEDSDLESFRKFLCYLYSGKTSLLTSNLAMSLLPLADKYDVKDLKSEVTEFLFYNLSLQSVLRTCVLANMHNENRLKEQAIEFIGENLKALMKHSDWKLFRTHADLVDSVLMYFAF